MDDDIAERLPNRKHPRLDRKLYRILGAVCSITIGVRGRKPIFADSWLVKRAVTTLEQHSERTGVKVYGYCFMPDHVHLVVEPSESCDIIEFIGQVKNLIQRESWEVGLRGKIWQAGFWDHFVRAEEDVRTVVDYVVRNPIRRGLAAEQGEFPYAGSLIYDL